MNPRKLKDKYQKVLKAAKVDSGKTGDLSQKYELVQHIFNEMDANDEERKEHKKKKELFNTYWWIVQALISHYQLFHSIYDIKNKY